MKTEMRLVRRENKVEVVELWWEGKHIGSIVPAEGPGVKLVSIYQRNINYEDDAHTEVLFGHMKEVTHGKS